MARRNYVEELIHKAQGTYNDSLKIMVNLLEELTLEIPSIVAKLDQYAAGEIELSPKQYAHLQTKYQQWIAWVEKPDKIFQGLESEILGQWLETVEKVKASGGKTGTHKVKKATAEKMKEDNIGKEPSKVTALFSTTAQ